LQLGIRLRRKIIATGLRLIATGIAIIGIVPTLIATGAGAWRAGKRPISCRYGEGADPGLQRGIPGIKPGQVI
jgi:hypothetical protein